ncbi:hypothetical protein BH09MYX1_BH09MYX1_54440 [soil metagenome]
MEIRPLPVILVAAILAAGVAAVVRSPSDDSSHHAPPPPTQAQQQQQDEDDPMATADPSALPPNHPPVGGGAGMGAGAMGAPPVGGGGATEAPAIEWKAPPSFVTAANTSSMRIATFKVTPAPGDPDETEITIVRAGGTTDANVTRWIAQFQGGTSTRTEKKVDGFDVTIVDATGAYQSGMSPTGTPTAKASWALLGAIIETPGSPYFFKMTGPAATVKKARPDFIAMIEALKKL